MDGWPLIGTQFVRLPEAQEENFDMFPLCVVPSSDDICGKHFKKWASEYRREIEYIIKRYGAVLFRGFGGQEHFSTVDFADFVATNGRENFTYRGGNAVRREIPGTRQRVFTTNESPPNKTISFHNELAQTPEYPQRVFFFCEQPASTGGETAIVHCTALYNEVQRTHPSFIDSLKAHGVTYTLFMTSHDRPDSPIGQGWRATLGVNKRVEAESWLSTRGYTWRWIDAANHDKDAADDDECAMLRTTTPVLDAVKPDRDRPGNFVFFNQLVAVWEGWNDQLNSRNSCVRLGDGNGLDSVAMDATARISRELSIAIPWQKDDIMYIDNMRVQHSRNKFTGDRKVFASLTK